MLIPLMKEPSVNESERVLAKIASSAFFSLWCYPSLFRSVGKGKELIDLTVYFDNTLILFSDKGEVKFQEHKPLELAWSRWYRSAVKESVKQLYAAEKFVRTSPDQIFLNSSLKDKFPFDLSSPDLKIHLIAVTRGIGEAAKRHFDTKGVGSSGTLVGVFDFSDEQILKIPFSVNGACSGKTFIHILDDAGLVRLLDELCTPSDFIHYLTTKEDAVRSRGLIMSYGEEETLSSYLLGGGEDGFGDINSPKTARGRPFVIPEKQWSEYRNSVLYALRFGRKKWSRRWSELVARFSDSIVSATVGEGAHLPILSHAKSLEVLASENVYSSGLLAEALFDKYETVPENARSSRIVPSQCVKGRIYIFLFFPWDDSYISYDEYREDRLACMVTYAFVARYKYPRIKQIVVLGVATRGTLGSETVIVVDNQSPMSAEDRVLAQKFMREENVLSDVTERRIATAPELKLGRNEPCGCGSGIKYKKCCYIGKYV